MGKVFAKELKRHIRHIEKTWPSKAWIPVRRGPIYCSPACGCDCTYAAHEEAHAKANALLKRMRTSGWEIRVWENGGWNYQLINGYLSLHISRPNMCVDRRKPYWCLISDTKGGGGGLGSWTPTSKEQGDRNFADPNDAVDFILEFARWAVDKHVDVISEQDAALMDLKVAGPVAVAAGGVFDMAETQAHGKLSWCNKNVSAQIAVETRDAFLRSCAKWMYRSRDVVAAQKRLKKVTSKLNRKVMA